MNTCLARYHTCTGQQQWPRTLVPLHSSNTGSDMLCLHAACAAELSFCAGQFIESNQVLTDKGRATPQDTHTPSLVLTYTVPAGGAKARRLFGCAIEPRLPPKYPARELLERTSKAARTCMMVSQ